MFQGMYVPYMYLSTMVIVTEIDTIFQIRQRVEDVETVCAHIYVI
jgi:hypothetical protein